MGSRRAGMHVVLCFVLFFFILMCMPSPARAETNIDISPADPNPGDYLTFSVTSNDADLERSVIEWYLNGALAVSGFGETGFTTIAGPVGTYFDAEVVIKTIDGKTIRRTAFVQPQQIDFLWHGHTYTPPFYKGLPLPSSASYVVITAIPQLMTRSSTALDPKELMYTWSQNGVILGNASGYGKQTIVLENAQIERSLVTISVHIATLDGSITAEKDLTLPLVTPSIEFYRNDPLEGVILEQALKEVTVEGDEDEVVVRAVPYYFSTDDVLGKKLLYKWQQNNRQIDSTGFSREDEIVLRGSGTGGSAIISLDILNNNLPLRIFQKAANSLRFNLY